MNLTKSKLKQIIKEEIQKSLQPLQEQGKGKPCRPMRGIYGKLWKLLKEFAGRRHLPRSVKKDLFGTEETTDWSCPRHRDVMPIAKMVIRAIAKRWQTTARHHSAQTDEQCGVDLMGRPTTAPSKCRNLRKILALEAEERPAALKKPQKAIDYIQKFAGTTRSPITQKFPFT